MSKKGMALYLALFLVGVVITVYAQEESQNRGVSEKLVAKVDTSSWTPESLESFKVSPDNKRVAYVAKVGDKWFVVVDGEEGDQYDAIVGFGGGRIIFDSADNLHYLAMKGNKIYLVEETIK